MKIEPNKWFLNEYRIVFRSLPNWANLKFETHPQRGVGGRRSIRRQETQDEESPEEVRQRNLREAEILASNLGEGGINAHEILSDVGQLRGLALLQESMEWFSLSIRSFVFELRQAKHSGDSQGLPPMPEALVESLHQLAVEFDELANTCILVLHLEVRKILFNYQGNVFISKKFSQVRVQCFHYLLPRGEYSHLCGGARDAQEADPRVEELCRVMQHIDEAMQSILHPKKTKVLNWSLYSIPFHLIIDSRIFVES